MFRRMTPVPLLEVRDLSVEFPREDSVVRAVAGVSFDIGAGEIVGLVGESGCGKSATALGLLRLVPEPGRVAAGTVSLGGKELLSLAERELRAYRGAGIAYVPQEPGESLNPVIRVGAQIVDVLRAHSRIRRADAWREAETALERVGIADPSRRAREYPHQYSGGMKQRALIAMALAARPKVLVADEPTTALDSTTQVGIVELLRSLITSGDLQGALLITHDLGLVAALCSRVLVMYAGRVVEEAPVDELFDRPRHPYTRALIESLPAAGDRRSRLRAIPGQVPDLSRLPGGCAFHPRCPDALERCSLEAPGISQVSAGHRVACLLESEPAGGSAREAER
jgi:oligopeptide/dipeptide ABC transporter ATP-binding protein